MQIFLFLALVCLIVIAVFIFQNPTLVVVQFLGWNSPELQLGLIIMLAVISGAFITFMLDTFRYFKIAKTIRELRASNNKLEKMNKSLEQSKEQSAVSQAGVEAAAAAHEQNK
ncbi:hypothetical protein ASZ90_018481 [hydrocarbon metagenome]|uniref:Lipopolysaccharide assembly protein A domain-containing protein n=1 Tax=hydrocarbon metagenome TaxID=938273 RepID=A0A0W8E619_9ZZZZ